MKDYLQVYGHLTSSYSTQENVSLFPSSHYLPLDLQGVANPSSLAIQVSQQALRQTQSPKHPQSSIRSLYHSMSQAVEEATSSVLQWK